MYYIDSWPEEIRSQEWREILTPFVKTLVFDDWNHNGTSDSCGITGEVDWVELDVSTKLSSYPVSLMRH